MDEGTYLAMMAAAEKTLYHIACGMLSQEADRQDAMLETAARCWAHRDELREMAYFTTWSARILINVCKGMYRRKRFAVPMPDNMPEPPAPDEFSGRELRMTLDALPQKMRVVIVMHYLEGFSVQEMAEVLNIPAGTVKFRLHQARKALKLELNEEREG